jgi:hypothetical protein
MFVEVLSEGAERFAADTSRAWRPVAAVTCAWRLSWPSRAVNPAREPFVVFAPVNGRSGDV